MADQVSTNSQICRGNSKENAKNYTYKNAPIKVPDQSAPADGPCGVSHQGASVRGEEKTLDEILSTFHSFPLISNEVAFQLLKIQSKYMATHPCLCTSRFRHVLHSLDEEHHQDLDRLCNQFSNAMRIETDFDRKMSDAIPCVFGDVKVLAKKSHGLTRYQLLQKECEDEKCDVDVLCDNLMRQLCEILTRLVTEYRAIFAIEGEFSRSFEKSDDELHVPHVEHRKRHEEEDNCPEEIKLMKVACEELTLECSATRHGEAESGQNLGPKFCLKSLTSQEEPEKDNSLRRHHFKSEEHNEALEDRLRHRRTHSNHSRSGNKSPDMRKDETVSEKNAVKSAEEDSTPASSDVDTTSPQRLCHRKRKERRDSISEGHDKKFSKSSSDVFRPCSPDSNAVDLTRSQSSSDFAKVNKCTMEPATSDNAISYDKSKPCKFYLSDEEGVDDSCSNKCQQQSDSASCSETRLQRTVVRPRRTKKKRSDSSKENQPQDVIDKLSLAKTASLIEQPELTSPEPKSPALPWKKDSSYFDSVLSVPQQEDLSSLSSLFMGNQGKTDSDSCSSGSNEALSIDTTDQAAAPISWEPHGVKNSPDQHATRHLSLLNSRQHLDRLDSHWNRSSVNDTEYQEQRSKIKQLSRQLSVIRRKVEDYEVDFEDKHGYRPSQADKQNNKVVRKLLLQHSRIKRQIRLCKDSTPRWSDHESPSMSPSYRPWSPSVCEPYESSSGQLTDSSCENSIDLLPGTSCNVVCEIESKLKTDRCAKGLPESLDDMNHDQCVQEKQCIQSCLSQYQHILSQPSSEEEKFLLKNLVIRYQSVKRLLRRSSNSLLKGPTSDLETIPEGWEIPLTLASPQHRINIEVPSSLAEDHAEKFKQPDGSPVTFALDKGDLVQGGSGQTRDDLDDTEQNFHSMTRSELLDVSRASREEKKQLRRWIKEKETNFLEQNGRPVSKDELKGHEAYSRYKRIKAKIKLVDALLSKRK